MNKIPDTFVFIGNIAESLEFNLVVVPTKPDGTYIGKTGSLIRSKNETFHIILQEYAQNRKLDNGTCIFARDHWQGGNHFSNVLFLIDDESMPLSEFVFQMLCRTQEEGKTIAMPLLRTDPEKAKIHSEEQIRGIAKFQQMHHGKIIHNVLCNSEVPAFQPFIQQTTYLGEWNGKFFQT